MFSQKADTRPIEDNSMPKELQLQYFLEPKIVHASWAVKTITAKQEQEKSWSL